MLPKAWPYSLRSLVEVNPDRLEYLVELFALSRKEVCARVQGKNKTEVKEKDLFRDRIQIRHLRKLQEVFGKGESFFLSEGRPASKNSGSVLFRKDGINCELGYADRLLVSKMADEAIFLSSLCFLMGSTLKRKFPPYRTSQDASRIAYSVREKMGITDSPSKTERDYLQYLIECLGNQDIVVKEHLEYHHTKEKVNLAGFFLKPATIVIKRQAQLKREIFTLAHELGHYLLNSEDIDGNQIFNQTKNEEETWCNEFAFHFILGEQKAKQLYANADVLAQFPDKVKDFSGKSHISRLAIYCHLAKTEAISWSEYHEIRERIERQYKKDKQAKKLEAKKNRELGKPQSGRAARPIVSPLEERVYIDAFFDGILEGRDLTERFKQPIDKIIYGT